MYIFQLVTNDTGLQLRTEAMESTIAELQTKTRDIVRSNPDAIGKKYRIWRATKNSAGFWVADAKDLVKESVIKDLH